MPIELQELLSHPTALLLILVLLLYGVLYLFQEQRGQGEKLASGHFAGQREREAARRKAIDQMLKRQFNEVAFTIGTPEHRDDRLRLYMPDAQRSTLVLGGPGSGKTYSFIDPALRSALQQGFPTLLYDFKYPSQSKIAAYAVSLGYEVHLFCPGYPESGVINPVDFLRSPTDTESAYQLISVMNKNFRALAGASSNNRFFDFGGDQIGMGVLSLAKCTEYPDLLMAQTILSLPDLPKRLATVKYIDPWIMKSFSQLLSVANAPETVSGLLASAAEPFSRFMKPGILSAFFGTHATSIPVHLNDKQLVIFGMDRQRRDVIGPLVASIIHMMINHNVAQDRELPLCVFLDELPTLVLPALAQMINENRSDGLCVVAGVQSLPQLQKTYGRELARVILAGFGHKVIFNPQDPESAKLFSEFLGNKEIRYRQYSRSYAHKGNSRGVSHQRQTKPLLSASDLLKMPTGECVVISPGLADKKQAYIPLKTRINIPPNDQKQAHISAELWPTVRQHLVERSHQRRVTHDDVVVRRAAAEALLPDPDNPKQQGQNLLSINPYE